MDTRGSAIRPNLRAVKGAQNSSDQSEQITSPPTSPIKSGKRTAEALDSDVGAEGAEDQDEPPGSPEKKHKPEQSEVRQSGE